MIFPDLSEYQATADITGIRKQTSAIILRVAYGANHPDEVFAKFRSEAHAAGYVFVGLYQYLVASQDVASQAMAFCKLVGKLQPGEIPILDLEEGSGNQLARADAWYAYVDAYFSLDKLPLGNRSWIYSNPSFAKTAGLTMLFASSRGWLADYATTEPTQPPHTLWQSTDGKTGAYQMSWAGCGKCDTNYYPGTAQQLAAMAYQPPTPQEEEMLNVQVPSGGKSFVPFPAGSFKRAVVFADFVSQTESVTVRLALHSASKGFTVHNIDLVGTTPYVVTFPTTDVDAASIVNEKGNQFGITFA
jgi:hypothetical protein